MKLIKTSLEDLAAWFLKNKRVMPWREDKNVYRVWVSEIMLQQTQVETVIPYFNRFISRFPDIQTLSSAKEDEVLLLWAGLGYYSRAKNLLKTARLIAENGYPENAGEWLKLPGIGRYTAGAVLSIAGNQPEPILDANILRVFSRLRARNEWGNGNKNAWNLARYFVVTAEKIGIPPETTNQALMELGALVCKPVRPECLSCPLQRICKAFIKNSVDKYPEKKSKQVINIQETVICVMDLENSVLLKREDGKWRNGLYDFPVQLALPEKRITFVKDFTIDYTVTHHKVRRLVKVYRAESLSEFLSLPEYRILIRASFLKPDVGVGSALKKCLQELSGWF